MKREISLNGEWKLYFSDEINSHPLRVQDLSKTDIPCIPATVPGNVEMDLSRAGLLPEDLFRGMVTEESRKYEGYGYWYCREFEAPQWKDNEQVFLQFCGVDCIAEYYLNDELITKTGNAFIPHEIEITYKLKQNEKNRLAVHLSPSVKAELENEYPTYLMYGYKFRGGFFQRKPAHSFGWDIFPRCVSAGLWRDVKLVIRDEYAIEQVYYHTKLDAANISETEFFISVKAPVTELLQDRLWVRLEGKCGKDSVISGEFLLNGRKAGKITCRVKNPKLWWPYGYGEPNIYETTVSLCAGEKVLAQQKLNVGLRTIELQRTESLEEPQPRFHFIVNGKEIFCRGTNWVPLDAYQSRAAERYDRVLPLLKDLHCNMVRVWGGGVYERDDFYDYCDRHGILVWQDFMMACQICPMTDEMLSNMEQEFTWVIRTLRNHPSLALWSGDNEIDEAFAMQKLNPEFNRITRQLLPRLVWENDGFRPFLPSSPYISGNTYKAYRYFDGGDVYPERHLWGPRDYYKADFYSQSKACFISETGYFGCPDKESLEAFIDEEFLWPNQNAQWILHSSDQQGDDFRVKQLNEQVRQLFGRDTNDLDEFVFASQVSQAEALKFFIERMRCKRPYTGGILWWNLMDGWPQISDAVVDYYYRKKLAYRYVKHAQQPVALMMREMQNWHYELVCANDTLQTAHGTYQVSDLETDEILAAGEFTAEANTTTAVSRIRMYYSDKKMLLIRWEVDGKVFYNHYLCGMPPFDCGKYRQLCEKLARVTIDSE